MRITRRFVTALSQAGKLDAVRRIVIELQGSLALTGIGHGSIDACVLGLLGLDPESVDPDAVRDWLASAEDGTLRVMGLHPVSFNRARDIVLASDVVPELHPNGMRLRAFGEGESLLADEVWYSTGGGFIASARQLATPSANDLVGSSVRAAYPYASGAELLALCAAQDCDIATLVLANEGVWRPESETLAGIDRLVEAMLACIERGLLHDGCLPGGLMVRRRAPELWRKLNTGPTNETEELLDRLNLFAMAVNEENAAGGRVVTAPTNGAAGIIPAVLRHYCTDSELARDQSRRFLLTAGGIGLIYKQRASISGAEMGCQGEVGVACSMAAAGLAAVWGGTPQQVAAAAEIGMEHNLGLTCDPVGGLVQIPCIERNAIGAVKAVNAARLALHSHAVPKVSLDQVIETMRQTGLDMSTKYKETSLGGLAVNVAAC
jgi:L-serine dehydratase